MPEFALLAYSAQQAALQLVFEQAPVAVAVFRGPRYVVELANPAVCALWSRTEAEALGTPLFELLPETAGQGLEALLDGVLATGVPHVAVEQPSFIDRHGRHDTVYWNFVYQPLRAADGLIAGITMVATEVSEQVLARQGREAAAQLKAVFEQAPVAIGVFAGPDYRVDVCNPGLQAMWGRTAAQVLHRPLFEALPEIRDQGFRELLDEVVRTGVSHVAHETPLRVRHGAQEVTIYVSFVYHPLRDARGATTAVAAVATDVSEQVAARHLVQRLNAELAISNAELQTSNQELSHSNQELTRTNVDLDNFIYTASHDLRAPISNIEGLLHALLEELPAATRESAPVQPLLAMMQGAVERFQQTIANLTDLVRLQQAHALPAEATDLAAVVRAVCLDLGPLLAAAGTRLAVDVDAGPTTSFSTKNLRSIVYNLLSNALKYRHPGRPSEVAIRCHRAAGATVLEVQDNGLGLDEHQQRRLFGMFQRLHTHVEGSGIGLYMVKKIVENAGGTVAVASQPGVGSTFTVSFPG